MEEAVDTQTNIHTVAEKGADLNRSLTPMPYEAHCSSRLFRSLYPFA